MRSVVFAVVALVAVAVLALGPASAAPVTGVLLALCVVGAAVAWSSDGIRAGVSEGVSADRRGDGDGESSRPAADRGESGVGDEPGPLRP